MKFSRVIDLSIYDKVREKKLHKIVATLVTFWSSLDLHQLAVSYSNAQVILQLMKFTDMQL